MMIILLGFCFENSNNIFFYVIFDFRRKIAVQYVHSLLNRRIDINYLIIQKYDVSLFIQNNKNGYNNIAIGVGAISADTISIGNIAIGNNAIGEGNQTIANIAIGTESLLQASGNHNIAIGLQALYHVSEYDNLAIGETSLFATTDGLYNIGIGKSTLKNNVHGNANTALGYEAGLACLGSKNIFIGFQAGKNETGNNKLYIDNSSSNFPLIGGDFTANTVDINGSLTADNLIVSNTITIQSGSPGINKFLISDAVGLASWHTPGLDEMSDAVTDASSLFLGNNAGATDDGANNNTAVGVSSLTSNVSGIANTALGYQSGNQSTGNGNIFLGYQAGYYETGNDKLYIANSNTTTPLIGGDFNTAEVDINGTLKITGGSPGVNKVLTSDVSGMASWQTTQGAQEINDLSDAKTTISSCVFLGTGSGASISSGTGNSAIGVEALNAVSGGSQNTAQGYRALCQNASGDHNTVIGFNAFNTATACSNNTALGYYAGFLTSGSGNVFLGYQSGYNETGSNKLYIANSDTSSPLIYGEFDNALLRVNGTLEFTTGFAISDKRWKKDIKPLPDALVKVKKLNGVSYLWRRNEFPEKGFANGRQIGFIAQEVEKVLPEVVKTDSKGYKSVAYSNVVPILVEALKKQQELIERQNQAIAKQGQAIAELQRLIKK